MKELETLLNNVDDAYFDFVVAMLHYAKNKQTRREILIDYIKKHPEAKSSEIIEFVSNQPDFSEDAAYAKASGY
ncbi:MAG: hypothetical protein IJA34_16965 [Lachnospiraceae bacterium]|nr:hypothetical protein [Lachnospiraceae bacterium]